MRTSRRAVLASSTAAILGFAQRPQGAVPAWIRRAAIPLSTPVAGHGFDDMTPLKKLVGNARIVALGEATHGTREFFQLKHRMLEFLVTQMGFSVFSIEANMPECHRLNDLVIQGESDPSEFLKGPLALWNTQEVLDMVLWMREYNKSGKGRVEFTGFDMQDPRAALEEIREFVARADAEYMPQFARASGKVLAVNPRAVDPGIAVEWDEVTRHLQSLRPRAGLEWVVQNARLLQQFLRYAANLMQPQMSMPVRDASMATNVKWILDQSKSARIVVSAHNFHVMNGPLFPGQPGPNDTMGAQLRRMYGSELVTFGFAFNQGSFRAASMTGTMQNFTVGPLPAGSLDATLAASGIPLFALDLRAAPKNGPVADWLRASHPTRNIMAGFSEDKPGWTIFDQPVLDRYDALFFVERTTAASQRI